MTGVLLAALQLAVFPRVIRRVGIVTWQRAGCLLGVPVFLAIPLARTLSWGEGSLFAVSVLGNVLASCGIGSVRWSSGAGAQRAHLRGAAWTSALPGVRLRRQGPTGEMMAGNAKLAYRL